MPDLLAGSIIRALDTPPTVSAESTTAILAFTDTSYAAGSPAVGVSFMACTTGRATIQWNGFLDNATSGTGQTYLSWRLGTGSTVGGGTEVLAADDTRCLLMTGVDQLRNGASYLVTGLTAGSTYNVQLRHKRITGTGDITWRHVIVAPAT